MSKKNNYWNCSRFQRGTVSDYKLVFLVDGIEVCEEKFNPSDYATKIRKTKRMLDYKRLIGK